MAFSDNTDLRAVLDGLGQGVLLFSGDGRLVLDNLAARTILGTDMNVLKSEGWAAALMLFAQRGGDVPLDTLRAQALQDARPLRFHTHRGGEYLPCWLAAVQGTDGQLYTMLTLDTPDWRALDELLAKFTDELRDAVDSTLGHIDIILQSARTYEDGDSVPRLIERVTGFGGLVAVHMRRTTRLMTMLDRLQAIRTGAVRERARERRRKVTMADFFEDLAEDLDELHIIDPETESESIRDRVHFEVDGAVRVSAVRAMLTVVLLDVLRNAIMYSYSDAPVMVRAQHKGQQVQIDVQDQGCGIRDKERERVFTAFERARQPQVIMEFGYGLSLYLCKHEVEAMNGRMWYESTEGVGTTLSFMLPAWSEAESSESQNIAT